MRYATNVAVQRVRFKRPPLLSWRRLFRMTAYTVPAMFIFHYLFLRDIDWSELELEEEEEEGEEEMEEIDEDALFIPLGRAKKLPREFYRGSDPEWQAFKSFAGNSKQHVAIQKQLVATTRTAVSKHKGLARVLGKVDPKAGRVMLSITFPEGPPQSYEINGLYFTENAIIYGPKEMSQLNYLRQRQALWPTAAFWSVYASSKYLFLSQYQKARQAFGLSQHGPPEMSQIRERIDKTRQSKADDSQAAPQVGPLPPVDPEASGSNSDSRSVSPTGTAVKSKQPTPPRIPLDPAASSTFTGEQARKPIALSIFLHTFARNASFGQMGIEPPRGTVVVSGLVEVKGEAGTATMDVTAAYDLNQSKYVIVSMAVKKVKPRIQAPKGGP